MFSCVNDSFSLELFDAKASEVKKQRLVNKSIFSSAKLARDFVINTHFCKTR